MKLKDITKQQVRELMGSEASNRDVSMMKEILCQYEEKYLDTKEIPDNVWNDMLVVAIDRANSS